MANERFDKEAAQWDSNPFTVASSKHSLGALLKHIPRLQSEGKELDVLEIGCGTGLLSLLIAPYVHSLTAVDPSTGMIKALEAKLAVNPSISNIKPVCGLLQDPNDSRIQNPLVSSESPKRFDLIISHLVLHHIPSLSDVLKTMFGCLKPGGQVALTDFENFGPEAEKFHPKHKMEGVERHGIARQEMERLLKEAGFEDVGVEEAFRMEKPIERGGLMEFPFLICMGKKAVEQTSSERNWGSGTDFCRLPPPLVIIPKTDIPRCEPYRNVALIRGAEEETTMLKSHCKCSSS
jgi:SAM-dependent methyltransferase